MDHDPDRESTRDGREVAIAAVGKVSEALECVERARGRLYDFHQLIGHADFMLDDAVGLLERSGNERWAARLVDEIVGRNVIAGRWTFQVLEEFDDGYYADMRSYEEQLRTALVGGRRHAYEAQLKERRRSHGRPGHEAHPLDRPSIRPI